MAGGRSRIRKQRIETPEYKTLRVFLSRPVDEVINCQEQDNNRNENQQYQSPPGQVDPHHNPQPRQDKPQHCHGHDSDQQARKTAPHFTPHSPTRAPSYG